MPRNFKANKKRIDKFIHINMELKLYLLERFLLQSNPCVGQNHGIKGIYIAI